MHIILCVQVVWLQMHPCLKGNLREAWACAFSLLVLQVLPIHLLALYVLYDTLTCTLHVYKPTIQPVANHSLFLEIQVVTLLLGEYTLFARANLNIPTTRLPYIFQQYSQHTFMHVHIQHDVREALVTTLCIHWQTPSYNLLMGKYYLAPSPQKHIHENKAR